MSRDGREHGEDEAAEDQDEPGRKDKEIQRQPNRVTLTGR